MRSLYRPGSAVALLMLGGIFSCSSSSPNSTSATSDGGVNSDASTSATDGGSTASEGGTSGDGGSGSSPVVFVIPLENKAQTQIYADTADAPYINGTLLPAYAHTTNFNDELPAAPSEPHYIWMEAGTNTFADHTFTGDTDSSATNSTSSTAHLTTQLDAAGISWRSYQEGMTAGTCPISSVGGAFFAGKHDPFVFFQDVAGSPPAADNAKCIAHHQPLSALADDLKNGTAARYNFVTPDLCHEMHGAAGCPSGTSDPANIKAGDDWLKANLQSIIDYALARDGYVFLTWDEGDSTNLIPFIAIGKRSIAARAGSVSYTHGSLLKSEEEIFGLTPLPAVASANDFADLFTSFP
ncbi:MAG: alkaline phosphatase family protein [Polyangiaceae bacterium]